jgi:hypothetical protein
MPIKMSNARMLKLLVIGSSGHAPALVDAIVLTSGFDGMCGRAVGRAGPEGLSLKRPHPGGRSLSVNQRENPSLKAATPDCRRSVFARLFA